MTQKTKTSKQTPCYLNVWNIVKSADAAVSPTLCNNKKPPLVLREETANINKILKVGESAHVVYSS
jgi:hypothetical protein